MHGSKWKSIFQLWNIALVVSFCTKYFSCWQSWKYHVYFKISVENFPFKKKKISPEIGYILEWGSCGVWFSALVFLLNGHLSFNIGTIINLRNYLKQEKIRSDACNITIYLQMFETFHLCRAIAVKGWSVFLLKSTGIWPFIQEENKTFMNANGSLFANKYTYT